MTKAVRIWFCFILLVGCRVSAQEFTEPWHYTILNGLPSSTIYELFRDSKNQLWFGTENGVVCFNGQDFKTYTTADGLSDNVVIRIMEDSFGRIWFHQQGKLPTYFVNGEIKQIKLPKENDNIAIEPASYFVETDKKEVAVSTKNGLLLIDRKGNSRHIQGPEKRENFILFYKDKNGQFVINRAKPIDKPFSTELGNDLINVYEKINVLIAHDVFNYETHRIIQTLQGVIDITNPSKQDIELCRTIKIKEAIGVRKIKDRIFVCREEGLFVYHQVKGKWVENHFLKGVIVSSIIDDNQGGLWVGTLAQGLYKFPNFFLEMETIGIDSPISFLGKIADKIVVGTSRGEVFELNDDVPNLIFQSGTFNNAQARINDVQFFNGRYYVATANTLYSFKKGDAPIKIGPILYFRSVWKIKEKIIAHSSVGIHPLYSNSSNEGYVKDTLLKHELSRLEAIHADGDTLLLGSQSGLVAYVNRKKVRWRNGILDKATINFIQQLNDGRLLIGTNDRGMYCFGQKGFRVFNRNSGLISDNVRGITQLKNGRFLLVLEGGLQEIEISKGKIKTFGIFDLRSQFKGIDVRNVSLHNDFIYIDAFESLVKIPYKCIQPPSQLILHFNSIRINRELEAFKKHYSISYQDNQIEINLSANNYSTIKTTYLYRLNKGAWVENTTGTIDLQSLKEGDYELEMKAASNLFKTSNIKIIRFRVVPPWYRSTWFIVLVILLSAGTLILVVKMRYRKIESRKRELMTMELGALQAQMNPHFTFNTLNSIQNFILKNDIRSSIKYLSEFSMLIRQILDYAQIQLITIDEEVSFLNSYIALEKQRLKDGFQDKITVDPNLPRNAGIPSMLIQPFVENAIWHGLSHLKEGGLLTLHFERLNERLIVTISDNGKGRKFAKKRMVKDSKHKSKGMSITQNRIRIIERLYKAKIEFSIFDMDESEETGTIVRIDLPLLYTDN